MEQHSKLLWREIINDFCYSNARVLAISVCAGIAVLMCGVLTITTISINELATIGVCSFLIAILSIILSLYIKKAKRMVSGWNYLCIVLLVLSIIVIVNAGLLLGNCIGYLVKIYLYAK
jgi:hypothetical protein